MELHWILFIACTACLFSTAKTADSNTDKDKLITRLRRENEELKLRLSEINIGLKEICKTFIDSPLEPYKTLIDAVTYTDTVHNNKTGDNTDDIKVISVESYGIVNDTLRLILEFETSYNYTLDWHQLFNVGNGLFWTSGKVRRKKIGDNRFRYTCYVRFPDIKLTYNINARIHNMKYSVSFDIKLAAISREGLELFTDVEYQITEFSPVLVLPENLHDNFTFVVRVKNNTKFSGIDELGLEENEIAGREDQVRVHYTWINTTSNPNTVENLDGTSHIDITSNVVGGNTYEYYVTLKEEYIVNGGLFQFLLKQPVSHYQFIESLSYGVFVELVHADSMSYIPPQVLVLYNDRQTTYKVSSSVSIFCLAMGNPRPTVQVYRNKNGRLKEMRAKELTPDAVTSLKYITVKNTSFKGSKFICKATNGNQTQESESKVELYKDITFDEKNTGVVKNSTKRVVVSCKAYGNPVPNLEMRLGSLSGPDLLKTVGNFTMRNHTKNASVRVDMIFSPPDYRYDVIYCVAAQVESLFSNMVYRKIVVHPYTFHYVESSKRFSFYQSIQEVNVLINL